MDLGNYLRFVLALVFVLGLIGVMAAVVRRYGFGLGPVMTRKGRDRRLQLVEILPLDAKRRAVLLRRDDVEHLVILGPTSETVVESAIPPSAETDLAFTEVLDARQKASAQTDSPDSPGAPGANTASNLRDNA